MLLAIVMRQIGSIVWLTICICFLGMAPASGEASVFGEKCDTEVGVFEHINYHAEARRHRRALNQIGILRINSYSDPWPLFVEFAKRLSVVQVNRSPEDWPPRQVRSIINTGGGDRDELAFVLLSLLTVNDFATELVHIYRDRSHFFDAAMVDRVLVYLPVPDLILDPTAGPWAQHKGSGQALLDGRPRIHRAYPVWRSAYNCPGSSIRGYWGKRDR